MATEVKREFLEGVDPNLVKDFDDAMIGTPRWLDKYKRCLSKIPESDFDHTQDMLGIIQNEVKPRFSALAENINILKSEETVFVHDGGEPVKGIGDLALFHEDFEQVHTDWKHRERAAFRLITRDYIQDSQLKQRARAAYKRYQVLNPENFEDYKVGLFVHLIDKIQAARFGMVNVFRQVPGHENEPCFNGDTSLDNILKFAIPLLRVLPNAAQVDLLTFVGEEIDRFRNHNLSDIADKGLQALHKYTQNPTLNP